MFFDITDGDLIVPTGDKMAMNSKCDFFMNMGNNLSMNMKDGNIHMTSRWNDSVNDSSFCFNND